MFATLLIALAGLIVPAQADKTPWQLIADLIQTLNAKDESKLRAFVTSWSAPGGPVEQRVGRFGGLAKQGGPFKIVGDGKETDAEVDALVTDREQSRLVFRLMISKQPALRIAGLLVAPAYTVEGPPAGFARWSSLDELAKAIATTDKTPGIGIAVLRNGKLDIGVAGVRKLGDRAPIKADDVWSIGSIGKSLCSTVIGALIEQGKLRWDETLAEALPDLKMDPDYNKVTLEQIMHHRGGIPEDLGFSGERVDQIVGDAKTPTAQRLRYAQDILSRKPIAGPGERFAYSNAGYALLSVIAERAAGKPYETLLHQFVFGPLKLRHSYTDADTLPKERPSGHVDGRPQNMTGPIEALLAGAGGGLFMSVGDLAKFGEAHLQGLLGHDGFLKSETVARLHKGVPEVPGARAYACGWGEESVPGLQPFDGHNGSNGTMRSQLAIFPSAGLVVVGIVNCGGEFEPSPGFSAVMAVGQRHAAKPR